MYIKSSIFILEGANAREIVLQMHCMEHALHGRPTSIPGTSYLTAANIRHNELPELAIYLLNKTEELCKLQKGNHQLSNLLQSNNMW